MRGKVSTVFKSKCKIMKDLVGVLSKNLQNNLNDKILQVFCVVNTKYSELQDDKGKLLQLRTKKKFKLTGLNNNDLQNFYNMLRKKIMNVKLRTGTDHPLSSNEVLTNFTQSPNNILEYNFSVCYKFIDGNV